MNRAEYKEVCRKYSEYLDLCGGGECYIQGCKRLAEYQVTSFYTESWGGDDEHLIGFGKVYYSCFSKDGKTIETKPRLSYKAFNTTDFETFVQMFIKNYKELKVELKKKEIEKDFE